jgi:hypothetical protein
MRMISILPDEIVGLAQVRDQLERPEHGRG